MDGPSAAQKSDRSLCKVPRPHRELTDVDGKSRGCTERGWKLTEDPWALRKLTEDPATYGKLRKVSRPRRKLKQLLGMSRDHNESCLNVPQLHGKLPEVEGKSSRYTEHFRKVPRMHKLLEEGGGRSCGRTES